MASGYLFLFAALKSEDYALLIGSLGLFVILAGVMVLTRRINWYSVVRRGERNGREERTQGKERVTNERSNEET
jgi:inner membrane protein involved in colicin E2 resistance